MVANGSGYEIKMSLETSVFLATFTSLQTLIGSVANFVVIITIVASRELRRRSEDRLILNLAVADFLAVTIFLLLHTYVLSQRYMTKNFHDRFYEPLNTALFATEGNAIFAIGIDTFVAVVFPLRHKKIMTNKATSVMIILSWGTAIALAVVQSLRLSLIIDEIAFNVVAIPYKSLQLFGMALLYILIYYRVRKQARTILKETRNFSECGHRPHRLLLKSAMTTLGLAILYYVTYLPMVIFILYSMVNTLSLQSQTSILAWIYSFLFLNSCLNPFAYALRTKRFKTAFRKNIWSKTFRRNERFQAENIRVSWIRNREQNSIPPEIRIEGTSFLPRTSEKREQNY